MHTATKETNHKEIPVRINQEHERFEARAIPARHETMAALHVGLAHFIHEITNPLHIIAYTVSLIEREMPKANGNGDPFAYRAIPRLKGEVDQMIALVKTLRSQLECLWLINSRVDSINLGSLINELLHSEAARFNSGGVRIDMDIPADLPAIRADGNLLKQALLNLLGNAREAMPKGGVLIIRACAGENSVSLEIADTGVGIPPGLDVFHPFATTKPEGMGLGLAITRHIVETYDGTITYRSQPGKGTTFCLTFPLYLRKGETPEPAGECIDNRSVDVFLSRQNKNDLA